MNGAEQGIRITIGELVISNALLKNQVDERDAMIAKLQQELADAHATIAELEAENAQAGLLHPVQPVM